MIYFSLIKNYSPLEQRDILAIMLYVSSFNKKRNICINQALKFTNLTYKNISEIIKQKKEVQPFYVKIVLQDLSISGLKYLNYVFEFFLSMNSYSLLAKQKIQELIHNFPYDVIMKQNIKNFINLNSKDEIQAFILNENIFSESQNDILHNIRKQIFETISIVDNGKYGIKTLRDGTTNTFHIFINGFITETETNNFHIWKKQIQTIGNNNDTLLGFQWASGSSCINIENILYNTPFLMHPTKIMLFLPFKILLKWKKALYNSEKYSKKLTQYIEQIYKKNNNIKIHLYGHSLGANLILHTLIQLYNKKITIESAYLLGGAANSDSLLWTQANISCKKIYNFYSKQDLILQHLYQIAEVGKKPIGLNPIQKKENKRFSTSSIYNFDVSEFINGHSNYIPNFRLLYFLVISSNKS